MSVIEIEALSKSYGTTPVLHSIDVTVPEGSVTAVLGASGSGKTTLLRVIAGFEAADAGTLTIAGQVVDDGRRTIRPQHRGVGYVPQDAALFPHLTVAANIGFGVRRSGRAKLGDLIELVGLSGLERRYPAQLSGGQQQRVALARALAIAPRVVLLDEPFGSLDAGLRESVRAEVMSVLARTGTTTVLVTHDQDEALSVADHIALIDAGTILAHGDPRELYDRPPNAGIATAIGLANLLPARIAGSRAECALGRLPIADDNAHAGTSTGKATRILVRPEQIVLETVERPGAHGGVTSGVHFHGHDTVVEVLADGPDGAQINARVPGGVALQVGQRVWMSVTGPVHPLP